MSLLWRCHHNLDTFIVRLNLTESDDDCVRSPSSWGQVLSSQYQIFITLKISSFCLSTGLSQADIPQGFWGLDYSDTDTQMRMPVDCTVIMILIITTIYLKLLGQIEEIYCAVFCFIGPWLSRVCYPPLSQRQSSVRHRSLVVIKGKLENLGLQIGILFKSKQKK